MERVQVFATGVQQAIEQAATAALVISLRGAIVVILSFVLVALRAWKRF